MNKYTKIILGAIGTILLGAVGSGVWDWVLSGFFSWLGNSFVTLVGTLSDSYVDSLYKDIWKGDSYPFLKDIYAFTFAVYLMLPVLVILLKRTPQRRNSENSNNRKKRHLYTLLIMLFALFVTLTIKVWETAYTVKVAQKLNANISILAPHIENVELLTLKAKFS